MFTAALFTIAETRKQPMCPCVDGWTDKENVVSKHTMKYYLAIGKKEILPFETTWIDLEGTTVNEVSQVEKDRHSMSSFIRRV